MENLILKTVAAVELFRKCHPQFIQQTAKIPWRRSMFLRFVVGNPHLGFEEGRSRGENRKNMELLQTVGYDGILLQLYALCLEYDNVEIRWNILTVMFGSKLALSDSAVAALRTMSVVDYVQHNKWLGDQHHLLCSWIDDMDAMFRHAHDMSDAMEHIAERAKRLQQDTESHIKQWQSLLSYVNNALDPHRVVH